MGMGGHGLPSGGEPGTAEVVAEACIAKDQEGLWLVLTTPTGEPNGKMPHVKVHAKLLDRPDTELTLGSRALLFKGDPAQDEVDLDLEGHLLGPLTGWVERFIAPPG